MAATNFTPIILYHSTTASAAPTAGNLNNGELAINITDGKLFYKDNGGVVQIIATKGTGVIGGSNNQVQYNSSGALAGSSNFTFDGTTATINTLNLTTVLDETYGGTGLTSYTTGDVIYASGSNTLAKLAIGANTYILTSTGSVPQWSAPSAVSVSTATNLAGGTAGAVPYQSGAGATTFLSIGTSNQVLTSTGSAPQWVSGLSLTTLSTSGNTTLGDAAADNLTINATVTSNLIFTDNTYDIGASGATRPRNLFLGSNATIGGLTASKGVFTDANKQLTSTGTLATDQGGTGLSSFTAGDLTYYASGTALTKLGIGTNGQILTSTGTAPQWSSLSGVAVTTLSFGTTGLTPSAATSGAITVAGTLTTANGGTGLTAFTANQVFYASSISAVAQSANLTFDGTTLTAANFADSSLTSGRVTYAGASGNLTDAANFTYNGTTLFLSDAAPTAGTLKAVLANGVSDNNFQLQARVGSTGTAPGTAMVTFGIGYGGGGVSTGFEFIRGGGSGDTAVNFYSGGSYRGCLDNQGQWILGSGTSTSGSGVALSVTNPVGTTSRALEIAPTGGNEVYISARGSNNVQYNTNMVLRAYGNSGEGNIIFQTGIGYSPAEIGRFSTGGFIVGQYPQSGRLTVATSENKTQTATPLLFGTSTGGSNDFQLVLFRSAAGTNAYYGLSSVEQGVAYRNLALQQDGGTVAIGTGTADSSSLLTIQQPNDGVGITIQHASRSGKWRWYLSGVNNENYVFTQDNGTTAVNSYLMGRTDHTWFIGGSEAARINSSSQFVINSTGASGSPLIVNGVTRTMRQGDRTDLAYQVDNTAGAPTWPQRNMIGHYYTGSQDAVSIRVPSSSDSTTGSYDLFQDGAHVWYGAGGSNITGSTATQLGVFQTNGSFQAGVNIPSGTHNFKQTISSTGVPFAVGVYPIIGFASNASPNYANHWFGDAGSSSYAWYSWYRENVGPTDLQFWNYTTYAGKVVSDAWYQGNNSSSWSTTSDIRIKQNIRKITNALGKIMALEPCHFEYKTRAGEVKTGFIANQFETVLPGHVTETDPTEEFKHLVAEGEKLKSIDADLIPYLTAAIQELKAEFDAYKLAHP